MSKPNDSGLVTLVTLSYLSAAIEFLEESEGFELPNSRRLASQWSNQTRRTGRGVLAGRAPVADAESSAAPAVPEAVTAATDLLVSAFRQACSKIRMRTGSSDAVLDCVITLAMKRAHETCSLSKAQTPRPASVASATEMHAGDHR